MRSAVSTPAGSPTRLSPWRLAAFAAPSIPVAAMALPLTVYLPNYYASEIGTPLAVVAAAFAWVRIVDMMFDPVFGGVLDRTRTRFGRFRPWLVVGAVGLMGSTYMLFMVKPGAGALYLWAGLLSLYAAFSIATLAHMAWASALSSDYDGRSTAFAWWQGGNVVGMILVLAMPPIVERLSHGGHGAGVRAMGWFVIVTIPLALALALTFVREPEAKAAPAAESTRSSLGQYFALLRIGSVRRILLADILFNMPAGITGAMFFFFFEQVKHVDRATAGVLLLAYFFGALVGASIWSRVAKRLNKHRALMVAAVCYVVFQSSTLLIPTTTFAVGAITLFLAGLPFSAGPQLLRAMMADVADEVRLETGRDRTGLLYAVLIGTIKIGNAVAVFGTFSFLAVFGFNPKAGAVNSHGAILGLEIIFVALPATLALIGVFVVRGFTLTPERHAVIAASLAERDAEEAALAASTPDAPQTALIDELAPRTGLKADAYTGVENASGALQPRPDDGMCGNPKRDGGG